MPNCHSPHLFLINYCKYKQNKEKKYTIVIEEKKKAKKNPIGRGLCMQHYMHA